MPAEPAGSIATGAMFRLPHSTVVIPPQSGMHLTAGELSITWQPSGAEGEVAAAGG
jgi:hypothetical protein